MSKRKFRKNEVSKFTLILFLFFILSGLFLYEYFKSKNGGRDDILQPSFIPDPSYMENFNTSDIDEIVWVKNNIGNSDAFVRDEKLHLYATSYPEDKSSLTYRKRIVKDYKFGVDLDLKDFDGGILYLNFFDDIGKKENGLLVAIESKGEESVLSFKNVFERVETEIGRSVVRNDKQFNLKVARIDGVIFVGIDKENIAIAQNNVFLGDITLEINLVKKENSDKKSQVAIDGIFIESGK